LEPRSGGRRGRPRRRGSTCQLHGAAVRQWTGGERHRLQEHFHSVGGVRALRQRDKWGHRKVVIASRLRAVRAQAVFNPPALGERWREWRGGFSVGGAAGPAMVPRVTWFSRVRGAAPGGGNISAHRLACRRLLG